MAESIPLEGETTKKGNPRKVGHLKIFFIDDLKSTTIDNVVIGNISIDAIIDSDKSTSYTHLKNFVGEHRPKVILKEGIGKALPWVHIAISNAKRLLLDIHHDIKGEYLQSYLNEFCYKFNRRYFDEKLFDRLIIAFGTYKNQFRGNCG
ncbi:hypothetical protein EZS27_010702 [termite gut metagenome]|uniref:ISXO2-like transposase domain-containing protein n=1 Tax=termite gut metagenome TaxID=433724 RepID=A0A5J4S716_9ZZZZ